MPRRSLLAAALERQWWQPRPNLAMRMLQPLAWLFAGVAALHRHWACGARAPAVPGKPVLVVGNLVVGGAGKTPTVIALIEWLRREGWHPGVVSRGHGRDGDGIVDVTAALPAEQTGDEPLLIHLRTGAPVVVGRDRVTAARALCRQHPAVDIIVSDDGLQHHRLARDVELVVFDGRGAGNGLTLPAGPLRQGLPNRLPPRMLVLYNAERPSTRLPGEVARRALSGALPLDAWWQGRQEDRRPLREFRGVPLLAAAGTGDPERFFRMLEQEGLLIERLPLPDHARYDTLPWPTTTADVVVTEKDAVKLHPNALGATRVWVVALDFALPRACAQALRERLPAPPPSPHSSTLATPR
jgi:tetraacyldisaccharide 4'-kinase